MKKIMALVILVLFLSACNGGDDQTKEEQSDTNVTEVEENNVSDTEDDNDPVDDKSQDDEAQEENVELNEEENGAEENIEPLYEINEIWSVKPLSEDVNEKVVLLTIDDAPDKHALEMANTLKEMDAKAIFFVNGHFLDTDEEREVLKKIHEMGFDIGNHTYTHQALPDVSEEQQKEEIVSLNDLVEEIIGERPKFFRAPHGLNTDYSKQLAEEEGMLLMNWSYGYDWEADYQSKDAIADIMVNTELLGNGSNLLMHDREWTAAALADIVTGLREKGFEIVDPSLIKVPE